MANHGSSILLNFAFRLRNLRLLVFVAALVASLAAQSPPPPAHNHRILSRRTPRTSLNWKPNSRPRSPPIASATITATSPPSLIPPGTKNDYEVAQYIAEEWKKQGLEDVVIRQYDVLGTRPVSTTLEMVAPKKYQAVLREQPYDIDPDTKNPDIASAWIGFSSSGEVTAPVVYAHSGNPEDYEVLRQHGIDVKGKIVLVRYSNPYSYRGFKALTAQRMGAAALLIYSDPAEDGYKKGNVFPDGPWGPESHIQRGAITYDFMVPGDPAHSGMGISPRRKTHP